MSAQRAGKTSRRRRAAQLETGELFASTGLASAGLGAWEAGADAWIAPETGRTGAPARPERGRSERGRSERGRSERGRSERGRSERGRSERGGPERDRPAGEGPGPGAPRAEPRRSRRGRLACVALPELALQLLLRARPEWRGHPVALVGEDAPTAPLLVLNHEARRQRLRTGMRYGAARSLVPALRAGVLDERRLEAAIEELTRELGTFSPRVEPDRARPGVFHVDPSGLRAIYGSTRVWAATVQQYLRGRGLQAAVVVGFDRGLTHALARHRVVRGERAPLVLADAASERALAREVPLVALDLDPELRDGLERLGVRDVGALVDLPEAELADRFGLAATAAHRRLAAAAEGAAPATGPAALPLQPERARDPVRVEAPIEPPDADLARLVFVVKGALHDALRASAARGEAVAALRLRLALERFGDAPPAVEERIEPAAPTLEAMLLLDLVRLRLGAASLAAPVESIALEVEGVRATGDQLALFQGDAAGAGTRDPTAADRAIARVRAAFGERSVVRATLRSAHLPEARFAWEPLAALPRVKARAEAPRPRPRVVREGELPETPLVRRLFAHPVPLRARGLRHARAAARTEDPRQAVLPLAGAAPGGPEDAATPAIRFAADRVDAAAPGVETPGTLETSVGPLRLAGPYRVSGGWWAREVARDYYYGETERGGILWLYYDHPRRRWFVQGEVD